MVSVAWLTINNSNHISYLVLGAFEGQWPQSEDVTMVLSSMLDAIQAAMQPLAARSICTATEQAERNIA